MCICFQIFCKVYGVGPSIAEKWYAQGLRTVEDVKKLDQHDIANDMIAHGTFFLGLFTLVKRFIHGDC